MFGYIQPDREELRFREFAEYKAYYCGLCKCIGRRFGQPARAVLNYDCTFIAMVLCGILGREEAEKSFCPYRPFERGRMAATEDDSLRFAADLNILLSHCKLMDDWRDERKPLALAGHVTLASAANSARQRVPDLYEAIHSGIAELSRFEASDTTELDAPADAFARMMRDAARCAPVESLHDRVAFASMMYHMGRWVYLLDAWEDREKDKKNGSYNPFNRSGADRDRAEFLLNCSLNEAINAYQLLDIKSHGSLLDNIMFEGCPGRNRRVLGGQDE